MVEAVVFDRDGVLTYFDLDFADAALGELVSIPVTTLANDWNKFGEEHGFPSSVTQEVRFFQLFWEWVGRFYSLDQVTVNALNEFDYAQCIRPYPEVTEVLRNVKAAGLKVGVLSNFSLASLGRSLDAAGLSPYIDVACAAPVIGHYKPAVRAYASIIGLLNVAPERCLYFDDEPQCVAGAQRVGMNAYLVDREQGSGYSDLDLACIGSLSHVPALLRNNPI